MGDARTRDLTRNGALVARENGITKEAAVIGVIELMVQSGWQFELSPERNWAWELMAQPSLPGEAKVQIIAECFYELTQGGEVEETEQDDS